MDTVAKVALIGYRVTESGRDYLIVSDDAATRLPMCRRQAQESAVEAVNRLAAETPVITACTVSSTFQRTHHQYRVGEQHCPETITALVGAVEAVPDGESAYQWVPYREARDLFTYTGAIHAVTRADRYLDTVIHNQQSPKQTQTQGSPSHIAGESVSSPD